MLPRIEIISLKDPNLLGYIEYPDKQKAIIAYTAIKNFDDIVALLRTYEKEPTSYKFKLMLQLLGERTPEAEETNSFGSYEPAEETPPEETQPEEREEPFAV